MRLPCCPIPFCLYADAVTDALTAATTAYDARALHGTADQIAAAAEALGVIRTGLLNASLPAAPEGFTREIDPEYPVGLAMMGGGSGIEARCSSGHHG